ncbi:MAG: NUDIX domain-containing protein [Alphaproteobacteria bacterium]|nr:NUDIX domain-containing protein [Alphaproteobacteria bacterium]
MSDPKPVGPSVRAIPEGDTRERLVCADCGFVHYDNPKIVVGAVVLWQGRVLLCRRAIAPRVGFWTLPAGYLELGESPEAGAARESLEEANARISIDALLGVYSVPRLSQVQLIYRAKLVDGDFSPGPESQDVQLFAWDQIPWDEIAFPSVRWALDHWRAIGESAQFPIGGNPASQTGDY